LQKENNSGEKFIKQASILIVASLASRVMGFLYRMPLGAIIGDYGNGIYGIGFHIYSFFIILSSAGLPVAISKMVSARTIEKKYREAHLVFKVSLMAAGVLGLICCFIMIIGARFFANKMNSPDSYLTLITLAPTVFVIAIVSCFRGFFQGLSNTLPTAISQLIEQIINAVLSVVLAKIILDKTADVAMAAAGATAATGIGAVGALITIVVIYFSIRDNFLLKVLQDRKKIPYGKNTELVKELFSLAIPVIIGAAVYSITNFIDTVTVTGILIASGKTVTEAGIAFGLLSGKYNTLVQLPTSISAALSTASIPAITSSHVKKDKKSTEKQINMAMRMSMIISMPAAVGIGVLGDPIIRLLFPSFPDGGRLLTIGALSIIFLALTQISTGMLQGIGKVRIPVLAAVAGAIAKIPVNMILIAIPTIEEAGAVIGTTVCYIVASCVNIFFLKKFTGANFDFGRIFFKPLIASIIMGFTCYTFYYGMDYFLGNNTLGVLVSVLVSMVVYAVVLLFIGGMEKDDILSLPMGNKMLSFLLKYNVL